jgi:RNA polymerase sigma-70 factor (ECF subfamily)
LFGVLTGPSRNEQAWTVFVARYEPTIQAWCRSHKLQTADIEEVTQTVLLKVYLALRSYDRSIGTFRPWLRSVVSNAVTDHFRNQQRRPGDRGSGDSDVLEQLHNLEASASDYLAPELESRFEQDLRQALDQVRSRLSDQTWQVFHGAVVEGRPVAELAQKFRMKPGAVYQVVYRVKQMLREDQQRNAAPPKAAAEDEP